MCVFVCVCVGGRKTFERVVIYTVTLESTVGNFVTHQMHC